MGILSLEGEYISIQGLDNIVKFTRFHSVNVQQFLDGLELAEDLKSHTGMTLYTKDTEVSHDRISKLVRLRESNPDVDFDFIIKRSETLFEKFRQEIKERVLNQLKRRQTTKVFKDLMVVVTSKIESILDQMLADENLTLSLYQIRFICETAESPRANFFADHSINVALFSLAIATSNKMEEFIGKDNAKLTEIVKMALFHNYGALLRIDEILELSGDKRVQKYRETNLKGLDKLAPLKLSYDSMMGIRGLHDYHAGRRDFIGKLGGPELFANILVVVDLFLQNESGLFAEPTVARTVVDNMNVKAMGKELNDVVIQALTLGLNLNDIFDFYAELDRLINKCPYESAVPYPLTGFKSSTIFVCKKRVTKCSYLELSVKAVNLIIKLGELEAGEYNRCKLLTPELMSFYDEHYEEIKESASESSKPESAEPLAAANKPSPSPEPPAKTEAAKPSPAEKPAQTDKPPQAEEPEKS